MTRSRSRHQPAGGHALGRRGLKCHLALLVSNCFRKTGLLKSSGSPSLINPVELEDAESSEVSADLDQLPARGILHPTNWMAINAFLRPGGMDGIEDPAESITAILDKVRETEADGHSQAGCFGFTCGSFSKETRPGAISAIQHKSPSFTILLEFKR